MEELTSHHLLAPTCWPALLLHGVFSVPLISSTATPEFHPGSLHCLLKQAFPQDLCPSSFPCVHDTLPGGSLLQGVHTSTKAGLAAANPHIKSQKVAWSPGKSKKLVVTGARFESQLLPVHCGTLSKSVGRLQPSHFTAAFIFFIRNYNDSWKQPQCPSAKPPHLIDKETEVLRG